MSPIRGSIWLLLGILPCLLSIFVIFDMLLRFE